jgi:serine/threonine-protein kinase HipA
VGAVTQLPNGLSSRHPSSRSLQGEDLEHLVVYKQNRAIGMLVRTETGTEFRYLQPSNGSKVLLVSDSPIGDDILKAKGKKLPPFFANLLPEGKRRVELCQSLGIDKDDEFSIFAAVGTSTIGDIYVHPGPGIKVKRVPTVTAIDGILQEENLEDMLKLASDTSSRSFDPTSVPGVQNKVSRLLESLSSTPSQSINNVRIFQHVIIKCEEEEYHNIVENERFFLELARECGIEIPPHLFLQDKRGYRALVLERFDRVQRDDGTDQRVHVEDGCQLLNLRPEDKYKTSFQKLTRVVTEVVDDPRRAAEEMLRLFAFSYVTGNNDLHAKNVSVWVNPKTGERELSPAYDLVSTVPYADRRLTALPFGKKRSGITRDDFVKFGDPFGLSEREVDSILRGVTEVVSRTVDAGRVASIGLSKKESERLEKYMRTRIEQVRPPIARNTLTI